MNGEALNEVKPETCEAQETPKALNIETA